jgi:hypothetical protein
MKHELTHTRQIVTATRRGWTDIQTPQDFEAATADLNQAQLYALSELAAFTKPGDIRRALEDCGLGDQTTDSWIEAQSSPAKRSDRYRGVITYLRRCQKNDVGGIPIASAVFRLRALNQIAEHTNDDRIRLVALREAHLQAKDLNDADGEELSVPSILERLDESARRIDREQQAFQAHFMELPENDGLVFLKCIEQRVQAGERLNPDDVEDFQNLIATYQRRIRELSELKKRAQHTLRQSQRNSLANGDTPPGEDHG